MTEASPRWQRRKDARPAEILEAAMDVFIEKGFSGAKLDDIAKRAGVAKGTLYRYFDSKEDVFRAMARHAVAAQLDLLEGAALASRGALAEIVPVLLTRLGARMKDGRLPAIIRMVIAESRAFPDLASIWHDDVVAQLLRRLAGLIAEAQARGEVRDGDPRLHVFSILGPMLMGSLFNQVFSAQESGALDIGALATQHARTILPGLLSSSVPIVDGGRDAD